MNAKKLDKIRPKIEYLVLRQIFINPVNLPVMTESYLRKDFHFAMYLGFAYGKLLFKFFQWSMWSTLIFFGVVIFTNLIGTILDDDMMQALFQFVCYLEAFIMLLCMRSCIVSAETKLVPSILDEDDKVRDPEFFSINFNKYSIDPFIHFNCVPRMAYQDDEILTEQ